MKRQASHPFGGIRPAAPRNTDLRIRLIRLAGGDPAYEATLRAMIWQAYCGADQPFGPTEDGMFTWFEQQGHAG